MQLMSTFLKNNPILLGTDSYCIKCPGRLFGPGRLLFLQMDVALVVYYLLVGYSIP